MLKKLVLVESPAKAKTIQRFVDKSTVIKPTFGHVRDLPKGALGIDVKNNFEPKYVIPKKAAATVKDLTEAAKKAETIYLATDPDREGEAIAWHLITALKLEKKPVWRIRFHEITKEAIDHAFEEPKSIDDDLVDAQQGRRVLDRLVGYELSPLLWRKIYRGLSAGRVQSVALRLITDREEEIGKFKDQEYWSLWATFQTTKKEKFLAKLDAIDGKSLGKYPVKDLIDKAAKLGPTANWVIADRTTEQKQRYPKPPFTTSTLQQEAGRKLRFSVKQTMSIAQKLYEGGADDGGGLITYMRTDSLNMAEKAISQAREVIKKEFGANFVPAQARHYKTTSKGAQEAHEAIRPTSFARKPESLKRVLDNNASKLYKLIWERATASQMESAQIETTQLIINPHPSNAVTYKATGFRIVSPGFLKLYDEGNDNVSPDDAEKGEQELPNVAKGTKVEMVDKEAKQHFTQPPPRFTEASLVKEMEKLGIGRPSTYAPTITTIEGRGYVKKEEGKFIPQEVGMIVIKLLKEKFPDIVNPDFTAQMEDELDDVADGKKKWQEIVKDFYGSFHKSIDKAEHEINGKSLSEEATNEKCPNCGKPLIIKLGRFGKFYACTGFPECRFTKPFERTAAEERKDAELIAGRVCPKDKGQLVIKTGRYGQFIGCSNYPNCDYIEPIVKEIGVECPDDGGQIIERRSRRGKIFWGCANYPKCKFASWNKPIAEKCPKCGGLLTESKTQIECRNGDYKRAKDKAKSN